MPPRTPLVDPRGYFAGRSTAFPIGFVVFVCYLVVTLLSMYVVLRLEFAQIEGLDEATEDELLEYLTRLWLSTILVFVVAWFVVAGVMHRFSGGRGSFLDALGVAGWAYAPELLTQPIRFAVQFYLASQFSMDASDLTDVTVSSANHPAITAVSIALFAAVTLWSVYILAKGTAAVRETTLRHTILPALLIGAGSAVLAFL